MNIVNTYTTNNNTINSNRTPMNYPLEQQDELLDLVNNNDQVIGRLPRSQVYAQGLHNFRAISALIVNQQGQLWIPRRTAHKKVSPLHLGFSVGGHVSSGETYDQSFERELQEELNLNLADVRYKKLGLLTPHKHSTAAFVTVYLIFTNQAPNYNREDFISYSWLTPRQLMEKVLRGEKVQNDLSRALHYFFARQITPQKAMYRVDHSTKPAIIKKSDKRWHQSPHQSEKTTILSHV